MKKIVINFAIISLVFITPAYSQKNNHWEIDRYGLSFIENEATTFSFNWILGKENSLSGLQLSNLFWFVKEDSAGWQNAIGANIAELKMVGLQSSFFCNVSNDLHGLSIAPLGLNYTKHDVLGTQIGLGNICGNNVSLGQLGLFNITGNETLIGQAGAFSYTKSFKGAQINLLASMSLESSKGLQASIFNYGIKLHGLQLGAVNFNKKITGLQLGLINIADEVNGAQIGIVNVSNELNGLPIGLIDIQKNGINKFSYYIEVPTNFSGTNFYNKAAYRLGSHIFYKEFSYGFRLGKNNDDLPLYSLGMNLGGRIGFYNDRGSIMGDVGLNLCSWKKTIDFDYDDSICDFLLPESKELLEFDVYKKLSVFCGFKQNYYIDHFNEKNKPDSIFEFINTPDGSLYVQNNLVIGVEY